MFNLIPVDEVTQNIHNFEDAMVEKEVKNREFRVCWLVTSK